MTRSMGRRLGLAVLIAVSLLGARSSRAATVVIVAPANPSSAMLETVVRIRGELISAGFAIDMVDGAAVAETQHRESRGWLERLAEQRGADAVVAMLGDAAPDSVEVWVVDRVTGKSVVRRVPFLPSSERAPEALAIRAIELLRSSFLEIDLTANAARGQAAGAPPPAVVRFVEMERIDRHAERFGVELGGAAVMPFGSFGAALLPLVQFDWALGPRFLLRASLAGLGTRPVVRTAIGSAQVTQEYGLLGAAYRFRPGKRLRPLIALSAGVLHTGVEGTPKGSINQGRDAGQWSFLLDGGLGASLRLGDRLYLSMVAHAQIAEPYPTVSFLDTVVATSARPSCLLTLAIGAWL